MALEEYREKRQAGRSPEPRGRSPKRRRGSAAHFVIQHHAASTDHYDFRLEIDGVLASWAVPKGPSINPKDKRMARRTEDHPMDYEDFEGIISEGEYGAGRVIVWDRGTYTNDADRDMAEALERGHLSFRFGWQEVARRVRADPFPHRQGRSLAAGQEVRRRRRRPQETRTQPTGVGGDRPHAR
jgi:DNA ligase D-like protein (predicted 3'-phosphoesterase)